MHKYDVTLTLRVTVSAKNEEKAVDEALACVGGYSDYYLDDSEVEINLDYEEWGE